MRWSGLKCAATNYLGLNSKHDIIDKHGLSTGLSKGSPGAAATCVLGDRRVHQRSHQAASHADPGCILSSKRESSETHLDCHPEHGREGDRCLEGAPSSQELVPQRSHLLCHTGCSLAANLCHVCERRQALLG